MEIEIRAFIENIARFRKKVIRSGAKLHSKNHIIDYWFCEKKGTNFDQVKQDKPGSYGLRIRKSIIDDKEIIELNCKVLEIEKDHNAFHEYETRIGDFDKAKNILECIGFKIFCIVDKKREIYRLDDCSINIENIKGFRPAVELEIIADRETGQKEYMKSLLSKLGIKEKDRIEKSITFLYMQENSFK